MPNDHMFDYLKCQPQARFEPSTYQQRRFGENYQITNRFHTLKRMVTSNALTWTAYSMSDDTKNFRHVFFRPDAVHGTRCTTRGTPDRFFAIEFGCMLFYILVEASSHILLQVGIKTLRNPTVQVVLVLILTFGCQFPRWDTPIS